MVFVWRGMGLGVLVAAAAVSFGLGLFVFDDPKLGNLSWLGWTCIGTAVISLPLGLATFGGEDKDSGWTKHHVFFIPVLLWPLILGAAGGWCLMSYDPPSNHVQGEWVAKRCYGSCPDGTMEALEGFTLKIAEDSVIVADGEPRTFEIEKDEDQIVLWRYTDDASTELLRVLGPDEIAGQFDGAEGTKYSVAFERVSRP